MVLIDKGSGLKFKRALRKNLPQTATALSEFTFQHDSDPKRAHLNSTEHLW